MKETEAEAEPVGPSAEQRRQLVAQQRLELICCRKGVNTRDESSIPSACRVNVDPPSLLGDTLRSRYSDTKAAQSTGELRKAVPGPF